MLKAYPFKCAQKFWGVALKRGHRSTNFTNMNRSETAFCLSLWIMIITIIEINHEWWQWDGDWVCVNRPTDVTCIRFEYGIFGRYCLPYNYGIPYNVYLIITVFTHPILFDLLAIWCNCEPTCWIAANPVADCRRSSQVSR